MNAPARDLGEFLALVAIFGLALASLIGLAAVGQP